MLPEAAFAAFGEGCAGSWEGEIPPYVCASCLQVPGWLDLVTDDALALVMAQLSLAIAMLCFFWKGGAVKSSVSLGLAFCCSLRQRL